MRDHVLDSPPSSVHGSEINEEMINLAELDNFFFDDNINHPVEPPVEILDQSLLVFKMHTEAVSSCDIHPSGTVAVTGSEDATAFVWSVENGRILMNCVGHEHSIRFVGFSFDGDFLATVDVCGLIKLWKCNLENSQPWRMVKTCRSNGFKWGMWHFSAKVLICGVYIGNIIVLNLDSRRVKILEGGEPVECGKLFPNGTDLAAGYKDGSIKVWNILEGKLLHHIETGHGMIITGIDVNPENNLIASISNGKIVLISPLSAEIVGRCQADSQLVTVSFFTDGDEGLLGLCCLTGSVTIYDVDNRTISFRCSPPVENRRAGITKTVWVDNILFTGLYDGTIRYFDPKLGSPVMTLKGHTNEITGLCYNKQKNLLLATADDGTARLFKYEIEKDKD